MRGVIYKRKGENQVGNVIKVDFTKKKVVLIDQPKPSQRSFFGVNWSMPDHEPDSPGAA